MAISKIILNSVTQMDVTDTTAAAADVGQGKYFYTAAGVKTAGTASGGGGGGATTIATGTFVGSNNTGDAGRQQFSIGTKMAQTDFYIAVTCPNDIEIAYSSSRVYLWAYVACHSIFGSFDLSTSGNKTFSGNGYHVDSNNSGTITERAIADTFRDGRQIYNGSVSAAMPNVFQIRRLTSPTDHFEIYMGMSNATYIWPSSITYSWKIVYFGSNPSTDIIDLS